MKLKTNISARKKRTGRRTLEEQIVEARQELESSLEREKRLKEEIHKLKMRLNALEFRQAPEVKEPSNADMLGSRGFKSVYLVSAFEDDIQKVRLWLGEDEFPLECEIVRYEDHEAWVRRVQDKTWIGDLVIYCSDKMRHMQDSKSVLEKKCKKIVSTRTIPQAIEQLDRITKDARGEE